MRRFFYLFFSLVLCLAALSPAGATISSTTNKATFTASGTTTVFPYTFKILAASDLQVIEIVGGVETVISSGYTVSGAGSSSGGNVTFTTAPTAGTTIILRRATAGTQPLDLVPSARINVDSLETALDRAVMQHDDQKEQLDRAPKLASDSTTAAPTFPEPSDGYFIGWNGTELANLQPTTVSVTCSAFTQGLLTKTTAADFMENGLGITPMWYMLLRTYNDENDFMTELGISTYFQPKLAATTNTQFLSLVGGTTLGRAIFTSTSAGTVRTLLGISESTPASVSSRGYLNGLQIARASATSVTVGAGLARDSTDAKAIPLGSDMAKSLTATWSSGSGAGGLATGCSRKASTWYHVAVIWDDVTADAVFYTDTAGPTMPAGYTWWRRVGSFVTDASSNVVAFHQAGDLFLWDAPVLDYGAATGTTSAVTLALSIPSGFVTVARVRASTNVNGTYGLLSPLAVTDAAPSQVAAPGFNFASLGYGMAELDVISNTSRQVRLRVSSGTPTVRVVTVGWTDRRGRDD